jgi:hypothetical protein
MYFSSKNQQPTMSGGITMSKALLNTKPRYPRKGKVVPQLCNLTPMWITTPPISLIGKPIELDKE